MPQDLNARSTLPTVESVLPGGQTPRDLTLTVIFHSDTARIGQSLVIPAASRSQSVVLGRLGPEFCRPGKTGAPLADPHVSRRALQLDYNGSSLLLRRIPGSSRVRVGAAELSADCRLEPRALREGVPLLLSHSVVLLLRSGVRQEAAVQQCADDTLCGGSAHMATLRAEIARAAACDLDVLIRGETGTGKELVANAIHRASTRADAPLVSVNMAAIPGELAAAALFGVARGAYTGADRARSGYFAQAAGGSLFLDEVGDTPGDIQPQLLRALQQREIQPVGGALKSVDVRVISATDRELQEGGDGFRAALRHRLGACEITLPPLREHPEDIGELLLHFLRRSAAELGRDELLPSANARPEHTAAWGVIFSLFLRRRWPGNVRELENAVRQVVLSSDAMPRLPEHLVSKPVDVQADPPSPGVAERRPRIQDVSDDAFECAMQANHFEIAAVARQLGVSRAAIYRRIELSADYRLATAIPTPELARSLRANDGDVNRAAHALRVSASSLRNRVREMQSA